MVLLDEWHVQLMIRRDTPDDVAARLVRHFEREVRRAVADIRRRIAAFRAGRRTRISRRALTSVTAPRSSHSACSPRPALDLTPRPEPDSAHLCEGRRKVWVTPAPVMDDLWSSYTEPGCGLMCAERSSMSTLLATIRTLGEAADTRRCHYGLGAWRPYVESRGRSRRGAPAQPGSTA
jgi:hypothetical protein